MEERAASPVFRAWRWCRNTVTNLTDKLRPWAKGLPLQMQTTLKRADSMPLPMKPVVAVEDVLSQYPLPEKWPEVTDEEVQQAELEETVITNEDLADFAIQQKAIPVPPPPTTTIAAEVDLGAAVLVTDGQPTALFRYVLCEVFTRFDMDGNGSWSHHELAVFHVAAFNERLNRSSYEWYLQRCELDHDGGITMPGLIRLFSALAASTSHQVWIILARLGYNKQLRLQDEWKRLLNGNGGLSVAFGAALQEIFQCYDADQDELLNPSELCAFLRISEGDGAYSGGFMRWLLDQKCASDDGTGPVMSFSQMARMFYLLAARRPADVIKRLQKLGFDSTLQHSQEKSPRAIAAEAVGIVDERATAYPVGSNTLLLNENDLTQKFSEVLDAIFDHFDMNGDDALDLRELHAWKVSYTNRPLDVASLQWLQQHFHCDAAGSLTRGGFKRFHAYLAKYCPSDVWAELAIFGYNTQLENMFKHEHEAAQLRAVATRSYQACKEGELPLCKGDIVVITGERPGGWLCGQCQVREGLFPARCVTLVTETNHRALAGCICLTRVSYDAAADDELSFSAGQEIEVIGLHAASGWWEGWIGENRGLFAPECCVLSSEVVRRQRMKTKSPRPPRPSASNTRSPQPAQSSLSRQTSSPALVSAPSPPLIYSAAPDSARRVLSVRGERAGLSHREEEPITYSPAHYSQAYSSEAPVTPMSPTRRSRKLRSMRNSSWRRDDDDSDASSVSSPSTPHRTLCHEGQIAAVAIATYESVNEAHLRLRVGADVMVLGRHASSGMWYGECAGRRGLFPPSCVQVRIDTLPGDEPLSSDESDAHRLESQRRVYSSLEDTQRRLARRLSVMSPVVTEDSITQLHPVRSRDTDSRIQLSSSR